MNLKLHCTLVRKLEGTKKKKHLKCLCTEDNNVKCILKNSVGRQTYGLDLSHS
jgi:hypothetical protein